ncbi:hypothetical protein GH868_29485 [Bacillus thuringiensis]|nr:hypothetical protein [Bacillus thuringiensis]
MKTLIILLGFVACAFATDCGMLQRIKVKQQWATVYSSGIAREDFGEAIWKAVFAQAPQARALFKRVGVDDIHSPAFKAHIARVNGGLDMAISLLDNEPTLKAELAHLNGQHKERGIPSNYYDVFIRALHAVVPAALGRCFDHPAWDACSDVIIAGIRQ